MLGENWPDVIQWSFTSILMFTLFTGVLLPVGVPILEALTIGALAGLGAFSLVLGFQLARELGRNPDEEGQEATDKRGLSTIEVVLLLILIPIIIGLVIGFIIHLIMSSLP